MRVTARRYGLVFAIVGSVAALALAANLPLPNPTSATQPASAPNGYRTVDTAITARIQPLTESAPQPGYLGIAFGKNDQGKLVVREVEPSSPAATAGFQPGDMILRAGGNEFSRVEALQDWLLACKPGEAATLTIVREGKELELTATFAGTSRPMKLGVRRVIMGVRYRDAASGEGATIDRVIPGMPADKAGMQVGDVVVECEGIPIVSSQSLGDVMIGRNPGDEVKLAVKRSGKLDELHVKLAADPVRPTTNRAGISSDATSIFAKSVYHLAVVGIEFPDVKHNERIDKTDWEKSLFSTHSYTTTSPTSQPVHGSLNDYYLEDSAGVFHVEGSMFDWVLADKKRTDYSQGTGDTAKLLPEVMGKLIAGEGKSALAAFDGIAFIYAGDRVPTNRGGLFWPHKGTLPYEGNRWNFLIVPEGGAKMTNISLLCHEFGHMLGLPDLYARPENPGSEGLGIWCLMSNQTTNGRPQHMSAWCKEQLGWLKPTIIDPAVRQKLVLSPVEGSGKECFKMLVRSDGSEYFLLENRRRTGFDADLPGEGLLIWRVVGGRPFLQASHGIQGPAGPRSYLWEVPFPSISNTSFTPFTTPSSRSLLGGGLPVFITDVTRLPNGNVTFAIGYQYY